MIPFNCSIRFREQLEAFCASDGHQNSNYCIQESLQGTYIIRCRNVSLSLFYPSPVVTDLDDIVQGKAYVSDCSADLECTNRVTDRDSFTNCALSLSLVFRISPFTGYERTKPDPNGDGRAQCAVGNDFQTPFNVTVYADDGSVYQVGPNEVSTPSPDYAGKGFFNDTFYPLAGGEGPNKGPNIGPADLGDFCETGPPPNVNENHSGISTTATHKLVFSSSSNSKSISSNIPTSTASVHSSSPTVPFPSGTGTGSRSQTSGVVPIGSGYHTASTSTLTSFTGDASYGRKRSGLFAFFGGITIIIIYCYY